MTTSSCVHHWICGDPVKGRVFGRCKHCGAERDNFVGNAPAVFDGVVNEKYERHRQKFIRPERDRLADEVTT